MSDNINFGSEDNSEEMLPEVDLDNALPSSARTTLNYTQKLYLYWLPRVKMDKARAYQISHPKSKEETAVKNCARFDRTVRMKCTDGYGIVADRYNKNQLTDEEKRFKLALIEHPKSTKTEIMRRVRPELEATSMIAAYNRMHKALSIKDPDWRNKLAENYDIDGAFERLADMSKGKAKTTISVVDAETGVEKEVDRLIPVSPETQRKTIMDMLAFTGMRPEETALDVSRKEQREKYGNVINQILNITVNNASKSEQ